MKSLDGSDLLLLCGVLLLVAGTTRVNAALGLLVAGVIAVAFAVVLMRGEQ